MELYLIIILIVLAAILCILTTLYIITTKMINKFFCRMDFDENAEYLSFNDVKDRCERELYYFKSKKNILKAYLYKKEDSDKLLVYIHGMCPGHQGYLSDILGFLNRGYNVFTYDYTATGSSLGKHYSGLAQQMYDMNECIKYLKDNNNFGYKNIYLYGHSMGGYAVACNKSDMFNACVSISGYDSHIKELTLYGSKNKGFIYRCLFNFSIRLKYFLNHGINYDIKAHKLLNKTKVPTYVIHGTNDEIVDFKKASILAKKDLIKNDKVEFLAISDEYHNMHNSILASKECVIYQRGLLEIFNKVYSETKDKNLARSEMLKNLDRFKANDSNSELLDFIDNYFNKYKK